MMCHSSYPSIISTAYPVLGHGGPVAYPWTLGHKVGCPLDLVLAYCRAQAHTHPMGNVKHQLMYLDYRGNWSREPTKYRQNMYVY